MIVRIVVALFAVLVSTAALADERILGYDIEVRVDKDGALDVTERIAVRAEGSQIRRGIYRDFPTRYRDRYGNRVVVDLKVLSLLRNDAPEPWFTEDRDNGVRINFGSDNFLPVPAEYTYTLRYRTTRQLGFFNDHDELYWNAIGTGWIFPIERGSVEVRLPSPVPVDQMHAEARHQGSEMPPTSSAGRDRSPPARLTSGWPGTTPASCQARSRRCAVRPEQPSSGGTSSQRAPVVRTNQRTRMTTR